MNTLKESTSYLKGLAEGMELDTGKKENKLIAKLLEVIDEMAERIDDLESYIDELDSKVDEIDQDLGDLEEYCYDDDCECDCDDEDYDEDFDDDFEDDVYEFTCDACGEEVYEDGTLLDDGAPVICPNCGEEITIELECDGDCESCEEDCE